MHILSLEEFGVENKWKRCELVLERHIADTWTAKYPSLRRAIEIETVFNVEQLVIGHWYRGKDARTISNCRHPNYGQKPDRCVMHINSGKWLYRGGTVQWDGPSVRIGQRYPQLTVWEFLMWAVADVSADWTDPESVDETKR